jgi:hypothetical protein
VFGEQDCGKVYNLLKLIAFGNLNLLPKIRCNFQRVLLMPSKLKRKYV